MMEKLMEKLKESKILGMIGSIILIICVFLPFIKIQFIATFEIGLINKGGIEDGINIHGIFILILAIINLALIFADKLSSKIPFLVKLGNPKFTLIPTIIIAVFLLIITFNVGTLLGEDGSSVGSYLSKYTKFGIGFYLSWIGVIFSAIYPFLYKKNDTI